MSADPTNGQSNIDVILKAMAPDRREAFLTSRNRLKQFNENDEILALAHYLDTVMVMVDGLQHVGMFLSFAKRAEDVTVAVTVETG